MKPWEETWRTDPLDSRAVEAEDKHGAWRIAEAYGGTRAGDGAAARKETALLISAAPEMARALLEVRELMLRASALRSMLGDRGTHIEDALKKAGVIP